ncbi:GL11930 [Drosophila persimilis]|uniref:Telomere length and silencing protein 1 homolog n=2 Tax=pseudoobscura subgroup TaxID=32358 RepID=Q2LZP5_DROPS|nr:telomere length and silencing protein 1 homolog [Drosophila pseudoobscura]XP_002025386.1 telomere length and silencing protein 1 homolog [Drosophila persimilis]XP_017135690.1 telomere length and silencing protein 1 homolog [Drosophila miranda]EDW30897.1 GL11930 [Drosophila persimilis]
MSDAADETKTEGATTKVFFKKSSRKNLRQRKNSDDEEKEEKLTLDDIKERQRLRHRPNGVSLVGLALGKKIAPEEELAIKDPFNVKSGGLVNMATLKSGKMKEAEDPYDVGIGTQFSAETNKRDEDEEMMKYIELELQKRKGGGTDAADNDDGDVNKYLTPEDAALYALPDHLRQSSTHRSEEMLSNQMLNGIPEVDLGIQAKICNIEATEDAKQKLLQDAKNKKDGPSQFVPTNMAVNFMQHNRFNIEENSEQRRRKREEREGKKTAQNHTGPNGVKRATDDYHYDKFRKQFRRY